MGVATDDPLTFVAAPLVLVAVALAACWFPPRLAADGIPGVTGSHRRNHMPTRRIEDGFRRRRARYPARRGAAQGAGAEPHRSGSCAMR